VLRLLDHTRQPWLNETQEQVSSFFWQLDEPSSPAMGQEAQLEQVRVPHWTLSAGRNVRVCCFYDEADGTGNSIDELVAAVILND
jgi:hypothetical protein